MRVSKEQAAKNRERILTAASRLIRERGISGAGVDALTEAAGMTSRQPLQSIWFQGAPRRRSIGLRDSRQRVEDGWRGHARRLHHKLP